MGEEEHINTLFTSKSNRALRRNHSLGRNGIVPVNRKVLVGFLIVLAFGNVATLLAMGILSPDAGSTISVPSVSLSSETGLTALLSTTFTPRLHQHYKVDLYVTVGNCANPSGSTC